MDSSLFSILESPNNFFSIVEELLRLVKIICFNRKVSIKHELLVDCELIEDFNYDISVDTNTGHLMGIASTDDIGKLQPDTSTEVNPLLYCFTDSNDISKNPQMTLVGHVFTHIYTTTNAKEKCTRFTQLFTVRPEGPFHEEERHYFSTSETFPVI